MYFCFSNAPQMCACFWTGMKNVSVCNDHRFFESVELNVISIKLCTKVVIVKHYLSVQTVAWHLQVELKVVYFGNLRTDQTSLTVNGYSKLMSNSKVFQTLCS